MYPPNSVDRNCCFLISISEPCETASPHSKNRCMQSFLRTLKWMFLKSMLRGSYNRTRLGHFVAMVPMTLSISANPYFVAGPVCHSVKSCNYFPRRTKLETFCQKLNRDLIQFPILGFFIQKKILSF